MFPLCGAFVNHYTPVPQPTQQLQPMNRMLSSINIKPSWHHTTDENTQKVHSHTARMLESGSA